MDSQNKLFKHEINYLHVDANVEDLEICDLPAVRVMLTSRNKRDSVQHVR